MYTNLTAHVQIVSDFLSLQVISLAHHRFIFVAEQKVMPLIKKVTSKVKIVIRLVNY